MRLKWYVALLVTTMLCPACKRGDDVLLTETYLSCEFYDCPKLTAKEQGAIMRYLEKVHWRPRQPPPPGTIIDRLLPDKPPISVVCTRWFQNGTHPTTRFEMDDNFQPDADEELLGQETPEYKAMVQALTEFRKRTPLRPSANFKIWQEMIEAQDRAGKSNN